MMPDINQHLTDIAVEIADKDIKDPEEWFASEDDTEFAFGDYYVTYRNKGGAHRERDKLVITVSLQKVLKVIMGRKDR